MSCVYLCLLRKLTKMKDDNSLSILSIQGLVEKTTNKQYVNRKNHFTEKSIKKGKI